jgi:Fructosamine kinase
VALQAHTEQPYIFDSSAFYAHNEYDLHMWRGERFKIRDSYITEYFKHFPPSEPAEEWEDRNRLYSLQADLHDSILFKGRTDKFRKLLVQNDARTGGEVCSWMKARHRVRWLKKYECNWATSYGTWIKVWWSSGMDSGLMDSTKYHPCEASYVCNHWLSSAFLRNNPTSTHVCARPSCCSVYDSVLCTRRENAMNERRMIVPPIEYVSRTYTVWLAGLSN